MTSKLRIVNVGLGRIAQTHISSLDPPRTSVERFISVSYDIWKHSELAAHPWIFAEVVDFAAAKVSEGHDAPYPYRYQVPADCLRLRRTEPDQWQRAAEGLLWSGVDNLKITYLRNVPEEDFDPLFVDVMAWRVARETVEYITQSNSKKADTDSGYRRAIADARRGNAFVRGPEPYAGDLDASFTFVHARY